MRVFIALLALLAVAVFADKVELSEAVTVEWEDYVPSTAEKEVTVEEISRHAVRADAGPILDETNAKRKGTCGSLSQNRALDNAANSIATACHNAGYISHSMGGALGGRVPGYSWSALGENLARGQRSVPEVLNAWMNSPGHRANIMNCNFIHLGASRVGVTWAQIFGRSR